MVTPTKIMNRTIKNWTHFQKTKQFKNQTFKKINKDWSPGPIFSKENCFGKTFQMFEEYVHNFDKSDGNIIQ